MASAAETALRRVREKYPQYDDLTDDQLRASLVKKYPEYRDLFGEVAAGAAERGTPPTAGESLTPVFTGEEGEPSSLGRIAARAGGAVVGGTAGGMLAGPPGAMAGAGLGASGVEAGLRALEGKPFSARRTVMPGVAAAVAEGVPLAAASGARRLGLMNRGLTPEQQATLRTGQEHGIPLRASEVTGSRPVAMLERFPERFPFGSGGPQRFTERQLEAAETAIRDLVPKAQQDAMAVGIAARKDLQAGLHEFRRASSAAFTRIERLAGDEPVVDIRGVKDLVHQIIERTEGGPQAAAAGVRRMAGEGAVEIAGQRVAIADLPPAMQEVLRGDLNVVPFWKAREIESALGELAFRSGRPIGTISEGQYRALYRATRHALGDFLESDAGAAINPELAAAKQAYRIGRQQFMDGINRQILRRNPEKVVRLAFRPGQLTDTLDFREAVSPQTWDASRLAWMAGLIDQASLAGQFRPRTFARLVKPYLDSGQVDVAFGKATADRMRQLSSLFTRLSQAEGLAANPSGTGQAMLGAMQLGTLAKMAIMPGALALGFGPTVGLGAAAAEIGLPPIVAKWTLSRPGINVLMHGLSGRYSIPALRLATQLTAQTAEGLSE